MEFGRNGFVSNEVECDTASEQLVMEALIMDVCSNDEIAFMLENTMDIDRALTEEIVCEKTIVRLDKKAKESKAEKMAIFTLAKERKDPDYKKLVTVWKLERFLEARLDKKYGAKAKALAKKMVQDAQRSASKMAKTVSAKAKKVMRK